MFTVLLTLILGAAEGAPAMAPAPSPSEHALATILDEEWEYWMRESPVWASQLGDRRYNDRWPDVSLAAQRSRAEHDRALLERLTALDRSALSEAARLNYDLFLRRVSDDVEEAGFGWYLLPLNQRGGVQTAHEVARLLRFETARDYEDWIARLASIDTYLARTTELLEEGMRTRMIHPQVILERVPEQIEHQLVDKPAASPFYEPFTRMPESIPAQTQARLRDAAERAIATVVVPSYRRFATFFNERYLKAARPTVGCGDLPRGHEMYAFFARHYTTTDLTPQQIHEKGLAEVRRIRAEMERIIHEVGFAGSFAEFLHFLRTDPRFYYADPQELLTAYRETAKRADPELVKLFGRLPRMPYGIEPIPAETAPDTTTAYYTQPAADGSRAGIYWVNLYRPEVRPRYEIEALTLHEAVPGHHLQIALSQELGDLPRFRRHTGYTAFVEGWGLYAESLGGEMGFYKDPYSRFGQLTYEMWRAVRLVVDTGMHELGWDRATAVSFFKENAAKTEHDINNEIDRYIAWPGQALAYKIGELEIQRLRRRATAELGPGFDLRAFHDLVLSQGAVPLDVLERMVESWIRAQRPEGSR